MPGTAVLDAAVGLASLFFLVALLCSAVVEALANIFKKRAKYLLRGLRDLLDTPPEAEPKTVGMMNRVKQVGASRVRENDLYQAALVATPGAAPVDLPVAPPADVPPTPTQPPADVPPLAWTTWLMGHPLVRPFKQSRAAGGQTRNPSYLPAKAFAGAILDFLVPDDAGDTTMTAIRNSVLQLPESVPFRGALLSVAKTAGDDIAKFQTSLEEWYDGQMDRIGGAYKRWAKRWLIVFGLAVAILLHVDSIAVARALYADGPLRQAVVAAATNGTLCDQDRPLDETRNCVSGKLSELRAEGLPVGWPIDDRPEDAMSWLSLIVGLALTAGAASFGAPFWFEMLNRLGSLRNTGPKPKSQA